MAAVVGASGAKVQRTTAQGTRGPKSLARRRPSDTPRPQPRPPGQPGARPQSPRARRGVSERGARGRKRKSPAAAALLFPATATLQQAPPPAVSRGATAPAPPRVREPSPAPPRRPLGVHTPMGPQSRAAVALLWGFLLPLVRGAHWRGGGRAAGGARSASHNPPRRSRQPLLPPGPASGHFRPSLLQAPSFRESWLQMPSRGPGSVLGKRNSFFFSPFSSL